MTVQPFFRKNTTIAAAWTILLVFWSGGCITLLESFTPLITFPNKGPVSSGMRSLLLSRATRTTVNPFGRLVCDDSSFCRHPQHSLLELSSTIGPVIVLELEDDDDDDESKRIQLEGITLEAEEFAEEDDEDDEDDDEENAYTTVAESEFKGKGDASSGGVSVTPVGTSGALLVQFPAGSDDDDDATESELTTNMDWGGALGSLRERMNDVESGRSQDPSHVLFNLMSKQSPNAAIGSFVTSAKPQVVQAMTGAVSSLLGGLSNPMSGMEMIVEASGEKMGSLCFQLQMTGYMFRNAEYVMALKGLMQLTGSATLQDYKDAFDRLDADGNGYIEAHEVNVLLDDVYNGKTPAFEIDTFVKFFDQNKDGRISWPEFERGLGSAMAEKAERKAKLNNLLMPATGAQDERRQRRNGKSLDNDDDDDDVVPNKMEPQVSGTIEIEMDDGKIIKMDAKEYIQSLKDEARKLKETLRREKFGISPHEETGGPHNFLGGGGGGGLNQQQPPQDTFGGIANYIASRQGDVKALTEGISPEIVNTMKMLVDFVLDGGGNEAAGEGRSGGKSSGKGGPGIRSSRDEAEAAKKRAEMSMEIPASALQQLALWQLILGYRLREAEAKGEYLRLLE
jgi:Protein of unknown function (DUF760)/EF-hand domain pair